MKDKNILLNALKIYMVKLGLTKTQAADLAGLAKLFVPDKFESSLLSAMKTEDEFSKLETDPSYADVVIPFKQGVLDILETFKSKSQKGMLSKKEAWESVMQSITLGEI